MEIVLAALLAGTAFFAVWAFTARNNERARAHRLAEELEALRRPSHIPSVEPDSAPILPGPESLDEAPAAVSGPMPRGSLDPGSLRAAQEAIAQALTALVREPRRGTPSDASVPSGGVDLLKQEARKFLSDSERIESNLSGLLLRSAPFRSAPAGSSARSAEAAENGDVPEPSEDELIADAGAAIEELSDPTSRMADDLGSVLRNAERIRAGAIQSGAALATVSRSADSLTPLASALSSLSNRINLLALNLAVLVNPGARDSGEFDKAGDELRGLFEETRRLAREVGSLSQRAAGAARSARETSEDLVAAATDGHARAERGLQELAHLEELTIHLKENLEKTRRASRRAEERRTRLQGDLSTAEAAESALASHLRELHRDAAQWMSDLRDIAQAFHDTRTSGEKTLRALLEACEPQAAAGHPAPVDEARALELLRRAGSLLEAPPL
ncbi:MAG: hypothetical protein ABIT01_16830 [Thermoanaerobaculia bacterium]